LLRGRRHALDLASLDPRAVLPRVDGAQALNQIARDEGIVGGGPVVALRLPQESGAVAEDLQDAPGFDRRLDGVGRGVGALAAPVRGLAPVACVRGVALARRILNPIASDAGSVAMTLAPPPSLAVSP
jgi:hypothetical protein